VDLLRPRGRRCATGTRAACLGHDGVSVQPIGGERHEECKYRVADLHGNILIGDVPNTFGMTPLQLSYDCPGRQLATRTDGGDVSGARRRHVAECRRGRGGQPALVTSTVLEVTGAPTRSFRDWAIDHTADFAQVS
jgi:hypothetical protein